MKNDWNQTVGTIDFHIVLFIYLFSTIEVNAAKQQFGSNRSSKYIPLCSSEQRNFL